MVKYDSDSSSDDENEYTTTDVILGFASTESSGDETSHIGGHPLWLENVSKPSGELSRCKSCRGSLSLLVQLNADLQLHFPDDTRRLYVWACKSKACSRKPGSVRAFREVKKRQAKRVVKSQASAPRPVSPPPPPPPASNLGSALFGGGATATISNNVNPFSTGQSMDEPAKNPFAIKPTKETESSSDTQPLTETFAEKLKLNTQPPKPRDPVEPWPAEMDFPSPHPFSFLDAYPEEIDSAPLPAESNASSSKVQYDTEDAGGSANEKDTFESTLDKTFQKFSDRIAQNPEQVLRYEFRGQPLLYSGADGVSSRFVLPHGKSGATKGIPRCNNCAAQRVFELQLTPYLIFEIEKDEVLDIEDGMEWGTIIVGTCVNNCGDEGVISFHEEWVGVQWEERVARN